MPRWVKEIKPAPPSLDDHSGDLDRLKRSLHQECGLEQVCVDLETIQSLPAMIRDSAYRLRLALFQDREKTFITGMDPAGSTKPVLGLAVDLGTTRYVLQLVDLETGAVLASADHGNPQSRIGPDILTRIHHAGQKGGTQELQTMLIQDLQAGIEKLCRENGLDHRRISNLALAGNTAMTHLFLGLDTRWLIREPYVPVLNDPGLCRASEIGLDLGPLAAVYCFPNAGSYFGGDLFAGILDAGLDESNEISLLVDVGTNAEVVLGNKDWLIGCAGAAGPALEGGVSEIGKPAGPGIIERVGIDAQTLEFNLQTISNQPPLGICGSGFIDLAAGLFICGLLDARGKFVTDKDPERFVKREGQDCLVLVQASQSGNGQDLLIGQAEIDSLIRSKAAMYTILETLTASVGLTFEQVDRFCVAGTFGQYIDPESAISIGMLPDLPLEIFHTLGNSSLGGATRLLQEPESLDIVSRTRDRMTYLELNVNQEFMNEFSAARFLPHTDRNRFPSVVRKLKTRN
ncbi:MAG: ASKHA domain-containing protein [Desulfohalobiaceae bacterium]|nr:ASKHA domain-containing protein [Desulfohalobiaceae bacterium]